MKHDLHTCEYKLLVQLYQCVLKFLAIRVYSLHIPVLIPHGAERHCTLNTKSGVLFAPKWVVALMEFRLD